MIRDLRRVTSLLALVVVLSTLLSTPARAVNVTVGGTTFDVVFFQGPTSFNANSADIQAAPWWGDQASALEFAEAYRDQIATPYPFALTGDEDFLLFTYANSGSALSSQLLSENGGAVTNETAFPTPSDAFPFFHYAYVNAAAPVPEIDGGTLGQAAMILLAFWLMLRRRAEASLRRVVARPRG